VRPTRGVGAARALRDRELPMWIDDSLEARIRCSSCGGCRLTRVTLGV
jgi:hypothetical protein